MLLALACSCLQAAELEWQRLNRDMEMHYRAGHYTLAAQSAESALVSAEAQLGPTHPDVVVPMSNLGLARKALGQYSEAESLYRRALAINEKNFGADSLNAARTLNNLAVVLRQQGKSAQAQPLHARALAIRQKVLG